VNTRASNSTRGIEFVPAPCLSSNQREWTTCENLRNVANTGEGEGSRFCQANAALELGQKYVGSPEKLVSNYLSRTQVVASKR